MSKYIVITSAVRTAIGSYGKSLKNIKAVDLGVSVISEVVKRSKLRTKKLMKLF